MVVAGRDVGGQRPKCIERRFMAVFQLFGHVAADHLHRHVARAFNHHLHVIFPGDFCQLAKRVELSELRLVVCVLNRAGAQAIAKRQRDIIGRADFANFAEMLVEEVFFVM